VILDHGFDRIGGWACQLMTSAASWSPAEFRIDREWSMQAKG